MSISSSTFGRHDIKHARMAVALAQAGRSAPLDNSARARHISVVVMPSPHRSPPLHACLVSMLVYTAGDGQVRQARWFL
jgi:hypothetical protein